MSRDRWVGIVLLLAIFGVASQSEAQLLNERCKHVAANPGTVDRTDVVVTIASTTVVPANTAYCRAILTNVSSTDAIRCVQGSDTDPTSTQGFLLLPFQVWGLDQESQLGIKCTRASTAANDVPVTAVVITP